MTRPATQRCFLFLQGPPTGFWHRFANRLEATGARVLKVNTCLADTLFWRRRGAVTYRGTLAEWPRWLCAFCAREGVTDILYYADRQPYHRAAVDLVQAGGISGWSVEFGYLRPDWITFVPGKMGPENMPADNAALLAEAAALPEPDWTPRYSHSFAQEGTAEVLFHLANFFGQLAYPGYDADRFYWPPRDYLAWLPEFVRERKYTPQAEAVVEEFSPGTKPFVIVALQLESDYQIRAASPFSHQIEMLREVFASFSAHAPADLNLIVKIHPLDNGLEGWFARIARLAETFGIAGRVRVIKGGRLDLLLKCCNGVIVANSTVGLHSIRADVPTLALGEAVFDRKGLTHQGNIDDFWNDPAPVSPEIKGAFLRVLSAIQLKGSFYDPQGQTHAMDQAIARLLPSEVR